MSDSPTPSDRPDLLRFDRQICFSLDAAHRAVKAAYRVVLKDLDLTYPQYLVMLVLWEQGPLTAKKLGEHLRLDSGSVSPLVKRLEGAGMVRRERNTQDERSVLVQLTEQGMALRERALEVPHRFAEATGFDLAHLDRLHGELDQLTAALDTTARG
ncbi:MarR family winged helix-turn-helix transcriptional regulator [Streptomyces sp. NPDC048305]|uniref:MarR family winged helix-turn-helix transcriptional regulator n=1 Tax=Streptomyces sp. NPDC048305 TaxID=3365532 RepID=UPI00371E3ECB